MICELSLGWQFGLLQEPCSNPPWRVKNGLLSIAKGSEAVRCGWI